MSQYHREHPDEPVRHDWLQGASGVKKVDPVEAIFREVALMTPAPAKDEDPYQSEEYQKFVESMVPHCKCRANNCPCDGVLAGGPCDMLQEEEVHEPYDDDE